MSPRHHDSPRARRAARATAPVATAAPTPTSAPAPTSPVEPPAASGRGGTCLVEVVLPGTPARGDLLADVVGALARARPGSTGAGRAQGPVDVRVDRGDGRSTTVQAADLLGADGLRRAVTGPGSDPGPASLVVLDNGADGSDAHLAPVPAGSVAALAVGPLTRRCVVVHGADDEEQIGVRTTVWLALSYDTDVVAPADASTLLGRVRRALAPTRAGGRR